MCPSHITGWCCRVYLTLPLLVVSFILLHEEDEDLPEDLDKVNEEIQGVGDEVFVTIASLPDDDLGVEHDEPTEDCQADVEMSLEEKLGPEEDVGQAEDEEGGEAGHEGATEIEILAIWSKEGGSSEASKDCRGDHEGGGHQGGVHHDGHLEKGSETKTSQECKSQQHPHSHATVLSIIRGHEQSHGEPGPKEGEHDAPALEKGGEQVHVGPSRGGQHGHGEAGIHILQMGPHVPVEFSVEGVEKVVNGGGHLGSSLSCSAKQVNVLL